MQLDREADLADKAVKGKVFTLLVIRVSRQENRRSSKYRQRAKAGRLRSIKSEKVVKTKAWRGGRNKAGELRGLGKFKESGVLPRWYTYWDYGEQVSRQISGQGMVLHGTSQSRSALKTMTAKIEMALFCFIYPGSLCHCKSL